MDLRKLAAELTIFLKSSQHSLYLLLKIIAAIWLLNILNWTFRLRLNSLGLIPRRMRGLIGIFTSTFLHQNFNHLFFNSIPLFVLGLFIMSSGTKIFFMISLIIIGAENIVVWCIGRPGIHIGASGLISGYFSFIVTLAYQHRSIASIFAAAIAIYYFGSIFFGIFPNAEKTSWESHLFGFLAGIAAYFFMT